MGKEAYFVLVAALLLAGCTSGGDTGNSERQVFQIPVANGTPSSATVELSGEGPRPQILEAEEGETVRWTNAQNFTVLVQVESIGRNISIPHGTGAGGVFPGNFSYTVFSEGAGERLAEGEVRRTPQG